MLNNVINVKTKHFVNVYMQCMYNIYYIVSIQLSHCIDYVLVFSSEKCELHLSTAIYIYIGWDNKIILYSCLD